MTTLRSIGVRAMGGPRAVNLAMAGSDVMVAFNRAAARLEPVLRAGERAVASVADASRHVDGVMAMLPGAIVPCRRL